MASPRMWGSPYRHKKSETPSKRSRFRALFAEEDFKDEDGLHEKIQSVKAAYALGGRSNNSSDLLSALVCTYGLNLVLGLVGAFCHIPESFPNRMIYIFNIVSVIGANMPIKDIEYLMKQLQDFANSHKFSVKSEILWECTKKFQEGYLVFLAPPVKQCIQCGGTLYSFNKSQITLFSLHGPLPGIKATFRCKKGCGAIYNIDRYSVPGKGTCFYSEKQPVISATNCVYLTREVHELMCESGNHAFVSHHAFTEIYNSLFWTSTHTSEFRQWIGSRNEDIPDNEPEEERSGVSSDDDSVQENLDEPRQRYLLTRKKAISCYLNGELLNEIHERQQSIMIKPGETREDLMREIDTLRRQELYEHKSCSLVCKAQGCETLRVIDSCWKVCMPHCMFAVEMTVQGMPLLNFPNVCTSEPQPKSVFCAQHHQLLERSGIPTKKEEFLKHIGCKENPFASEDIKKVDQKTLELARRLKNEHPQETTDDSSAASYQGTEEMIHRIDPKKWDDGAICNKDTGQKSRLRQRSRGHFISVTGGGHIQYFEPIFKSESPSQVFMIVLRVMVLELGNIPEEELDERLEKFVLSYDNMCQLDSLRASKEPLPFPAPYDLMWQKIKKIIDRLHIKNHKNPKCKDLYSPDQIPAEHNTMIAEQTFSWFSRFKKIVNSMNQVHHLFYIHRNIKRRNAYTAQCRRTGKSPLLPGINEKVCSKTYK